MNNPGDDTLEAMMLAMLDATDNAEGYAAVLQYGIGPQGKAEMRAVWDVVMARTAKDREDAARYRWLRSLADGHYGVMCRLQALRLAAKECADAAASAGALECGLHAMGETTAAKLEMAYRMAAEHCEQAILARAEFDLIEGDSA